MQCPETLEALHVRDDISISHGSIALDGVQYDGEEEDKDDGSTHATVVADLAETTKPKGEREALESERRNQTNQANSKMKAPGATTETRRGRERKPNACHRQIRDQTSRVSRLVTKGEVTTRNHEGGRRRTGGEKTNTTREDEHDHGATTEMPRGRSPRTSHTTETAMKGSQDNESKLKEAATRTTELQGPGRWRRVARERPYNYALSRVAVR